MIKLNEESKRHIERNVGLPFDIMVKMSATDIDSFIEKRIGKKLKYFYGYQKYIK